MPRTSGPVGRARRRRDGGNARIECPSLFFVLRRAPSRAHRPGSSDGSCRSQGSSGRRRAASARPRSGEVALDLEHQEAVLRVTRGNAQQVCILRTSAAGRHVHQIRDGSAVAQVEPARRRGPVAEFRGARGVEDLLLDPWQRSRRRRPRPCVQPDTRSVALVFARGLLLQDGTTDSLPAGLDLDVHGLGTGVRRQVVLKSLRAPTSPRACTGGDAHALDLVSAHAPWRRS